MIYTIKLLKVAETWGVSTETVEHHIEICLCEC